ncbi:alpha/beta hydrolase [Streptomyces sp. NPDC051940]|uniref:alpha/beta hydrolase n=1 Tax=Streptomyces sp. NPDC051940 TaxID=3155675 RepID=UPI00343C7E6B
MLTRPANAARTREAALGRSLGPAGTPQGVALLLPAGPPEGTGRPTRLSSAAVRQLARALARAGRRDGLAAHVVQYRVRGWNGDAADPVRDAMWAVDEVVRRYGDVPVALIGVDMGGRAALRAAGHDAVGSVAALAPWLPADSVADEPVKQLAGRRVLIVHGTDDARTEPESSYRLAERVKKANRDVCRFEVHTDGHTLSGHRAEVGALTADFVLGSLFERDYARSLADAFAAPPPLGLRMPLAAGFGSAAYH